MIDYTRLEYERVSDGATIIQCALEDVEQLEAENIRLEELAQGRRELLDYDDKRILELSTENTRLKEQCARLEQEYIRLYKQLYKEE